ncbi:MAG: ABC transporter substrate-binding protein [Syntrophales bacterium]|nr:ABC transporter substrate-binding protein [Syntrophales bacterium]
MSFIFDTLIWKNNNGFIPALAESWNYNPSDMTFTFHLNSNAKWHDGKPVTGEDVAFTVEYFRTHPYRFIKIADIEDVQPEDGNTVVFRLSTPYAPFLSIIGASMPILPKHIWETVEKPEVYDDPKAFVGSGPYLFGDFDKTKGTYLYRAFVDYYLGCPKVDRLIYIRSANPLLSLTSGEADLANIRPEMAKHLAKKGMTVISDEHGWVKKLMVNHKKWPLSETRFRKALAYAINQSEIIEKSHRGFASPASYGLLSVDHEMYNPAVPTYPYNPAKSIQLLESLGFTKNQSGMFQKNGKELKLELLCSTITAAGENVADRDGEVIKNQLQHIGIEIELIHMERTTADVHIKKWDFDLALSGHGGITGDPVIMNQMILSSYGGGSVNSSRYDENRQLNEILEKSVSEMDHKKRTELVYEAQMIYATELPSIALYYPHAFSAYNPEKSVHWFYTKGGMATGIPISQNKTALIR